MLCKIARPSDPGRVAEEEVPVALDVFLMLSRDAAGVQLPTQDEVHDSGLQDASGYFVELKSYHFGVTNVSPASSKSGGAGAGRANFNDLIVTKQVDQLTPSLMLACANGAPFGEMKLMARRAGAAAGKTADCYLVYSLKQVVVKSVTWASANADDVPEEHVALAYGALKVEYRPQDKTGKLMVGVSSAWSVVLNQPTYATT
jgi:type VI secretion system secreted protein Hcp